MTRHPSKPTHSEKLCNKENSTNCQNTERPPQTQQYKQDEEEEIGNLPDKEFQIMIVKMIQNLENKMELQTNSLETRIEKMQERFNKDLEEIKKSINNE